MPGEFRMITDVSSVSPKELRFNYEELKAWLSEALAEYKSLVVTEDGVRDAKAILAKVNKAEKSINDYRISVKRQILFAYDQDFKPKCDELTQICRDCADNLKTQIAGFEEKRKAEKIDGLRQYFHENVGEASDYIHFDAIYNKRWENVTYPEEQAHIDIQKEIAGCISAVNAIRSLRSPFETALLDYYRQTRDLAAVLAKNEQYIRAQEIEERRKAEAAARAAQEEAERQARAEAERQRQEEMAEKMRAARDALAAAQEPVQKPAEEEPAAPEPEEEPTYTLDFRVMATKAQLAMLKDFLVSNGIKYGRVPKE